VLTTAPPNWSFDAVIVGGGMVGGTLACALARDGLSVGVVESRPAVAPADEPDEPFDLRVSALTRASEAVLRRLGVWAGVERRRLAPFREMFVWDAYSAGAVGFDSAEVAEPTLGHIVENRVLVQALEERIQGLPGITWLRPERPLALRVGDASAVLRLESGLVSCRLVVGADGARSRLRDLAHIGVRSRPYGHRALVATVRPERGHGETAWQCFLPTGPLAFLPLPDGHCSIVWSAPDWRVEELLALSAQVFAQALGEAFEGRLGRILWVGRRVAFPLVRQHADQYVRERVALVGDAAHTIHPLAGQGVNLGLLDAAALAEVVADAVRGGKDPGSLRSLHRYERWRRGHNLLVQSAMDGFKALFGTEAAPVAALRGAGLRLTDRAGPAKRLIMSQAMGLAGDLPALARPSVGRW
jgi:2-octaprenylphenol hydroxylase